MPMPMSGVPRHGEIALDVRILRLIATVIEVCDPPREGARGHPPAETVRVLSDLAALPARGHALAQPDRDSGSGERLDPAAVADTLGRDGRAGPGARPAGRHAAGPSRPDPGQLLGARQARRRSDRTQSDRPRQAGHEVPCCGGWGWRAGCVCGNGRQCQRHARLRAAVPGRLRGHGADPDRVRRQRATTPSTIAICAASSVSRPRSTSVASHPDRDWASGAGRSSAATPGCWRTSVSPCAMTGSASSSSRCFRAHASSWLQNASLANSENRLLGAGRKVAGPGWSYFLRNTVGCFQQ